VGPWRVREIATQGHTAADPGVPTTSRRARRAHAAGPESLHRAAWAGLQDGMPEPRCLLHARVDGSSRRRGRPRLPFVGPRYSTYVVAKRDLALFRSGGFPTMPRAGFGRAPLVELHAHRWQADDGPRGRARQRGQVRRRQAQSPSAEAPVRRRFDGRRCGTIRPTLSRPRSTLPHISDHDGSRVRPLGRDLPPATDAFASPRDRCSRSIAARR
jgi:hypothetical protein